MIQYEELNASENVRRNKEYQDFMNSLKESKNYAPKKTSKKIDKQKDLQKLPSFSDLVKKLPEQKASFENGQIDIKEKYEIDGDKMVPKYSEGYIQGADNQKYYKDQYSAQFKELIIFLTFILLIIGLIFLLKSNFLTKK